MMSFKDSVITCVKIKAFTVRGRAMRSEYWWFALFYLIVGMVAYILNIVVPIVGPIIYAVISLLLFIFSFTAGVRRLHDLNRSGWWLVSPYVLALLAVAAMLFSLLSASTVMMSIGAFLCFASAAAFLVLFIMMMFKGTRGPNRFGEDPLDSFLK